MSGFLTLVEVFAGLACVICAVLAWAAMSRSTRQCFRFVYGLIGVAGLAMVCAPFCEPYVFFDVELIRYAHVAIILGFALYLVLDRRRIRPERKPAPAAPAPVAAQQDPDRTLPNMSLHA